MTVSLFCTSTLSDTGALDRRRYTSPHILRITPRIPGPVPSPHSLRITPLIPGPVTPARNSFHGCKLLSAARLSSSHCTRPHPCTVTAAHHPHTRPPDIPARLAYQGSLVNTYFFLGLRRPRSRNSADHPSRRASVTTRSGAGSDHLPGGRRTMTGSDDDAPAARGPPLGARARLQHTTFCMRALRTCITQ
jgi:hypothetical protein